ncbi:MAG: PAS domain S-box protein, partial [Bacteroidia bacterium]|nr:PAS domain S-box protein [Bacteroidia bacterium]
EIANPLYLELIDKKDIIGKTVEQVLPEMVEQGFIRLLDRVYETGETFIANEMPVTVIQAGNKEPVDKYLNFVYQAYHNLENKVEGIFVFIIDVTEQVLSRKKIEKSELRYRSLIEQATDAICISDASMRLIDVNPAGCLLSGYSKKEILQLSLPDILFIEDLKTNPFRIKNIEPGKTIWNERRLKRKDGIGIDMEVSTKIMEDGRFIMFGHDITERKKSEIRLHELNENLLKQTKELAVSNAELEQFAYVASHDLQEPLRMVTSFLTQLEKKYGNVIDDRGKKYIDFAVDGAKRMRMIILDLLEFSRVGRMEDKLEDIDLNEVVEEIQGLYRKQISEKNAVVLADKLPVINSYNAPVRQVFQNLVSNALKYSRKDHPTRIQISVTESEEHWQFA